MLRGCEVCSRTVSKQWTQSKAVNNKKELSRKTLLEIRDGSASSDLGGIRSAPEGRSLRAAATLYLIRAVSVSPAGTHESGECADRQRPGPT